MMRRLFRLLLLTALLLPYLALADQELAQQDFHGGKVLASDTYRMIEDMTLDEVWSLPCEADLGGRVIVRNTIVLDLQGHRLTLKGKARFDIQGSLTIMDSVGGGSLMADITSGEKDQDGSNYLFRVRNAYDGEKYLASGLLDIRLDSSNAVTGYLGLLYIDNADGDPAHAPQVSFSGGRYLGDLRQVGVVSNGLVVNQGGTFSVTDDAVLSLSLGSFSQAVITNEGTVLLQDCQVNAGIHNSSDAEMILKNCQFQMRYIVYNTGHMKLCGKTAFSKAKEGGYEVFMDGCLQLHDDAVADLAYVRSVGTLIMSGNARLSLTDWSGTQKGDPLPIDTLRMSGSACLSNSAQGALQVNSADLRDSAVITGGRNELLLTGVKALNIQDKASIEGSQCGTAVKLTADGVLTMAGGTVTGKEHALAGTGYVRFDPAQGAELPVLKGGSSVIDTPEDSFDIRCSVPGYGAVLCDNTQGTDPWIREMNTEAITDALSGSRVPRYMTLAKAVRVQAVGAPEGILTPAISHDGTGLGNDTWIIPGDTLTLSAGSFDHEQYGFAGWYDGDTLLSEKETADLTFDSSATVTGRVKPLYRLTIAYSTDGGDTVVPSCSFAKVTASPAALVSREGTEYQLTASLTDSTMSVMGWLDMTEQTQLSLNASCSLTLMRDTTLVLCMSPRSVVRTWCTVSVKGMGQAWIGDDEACVTRDAAAGTRLTLHARPDTDAGYVLDHWSVNDVPASETGESLTFALVEGRNRAVAVMRYDLVRVMAIADPQVPGARVTMAGETGSTAAHTQFSGIPITMSVEPMTGSAWSFDCWKDAEGNEVSRDTSFTFTPSSNTTGALLYIPFTACYVPAMVQLKALAAVGGSVTGGGACQYLQEAELTATADEGYRFVRWSCGGEALGTENPLRLKADRNRTILAEFETLESDLKITVKGSPGASVTVTGQSPDGYRWWDALTLTPVPQETTYFDSWLGADGSLVSKEQPYSFVLKEPVQLVAQFKSKYRISTVFEPAGAAEGSQVTGAGWYRPGLPVTLTATDLLGSDWYFDHWERNGVWLSTDPSFTYIPTGNDTVTAVMARRTGQDVTLSVSAGEGGGVSWNIDALISRPVTLQQHQQVTLSAHADDHYRFDHWERSDGATLSSAADFTLWVHGDITLKAVFVWDMYTLTMETEGDPQAVMDFTGSSPMPQLQADGTWLMRQKGLLRIQATPSVGMSLEEWTYAFAGQQAMTVSANPLVLTMRQDLRLKAVFSARMLTLQLDSRGKGTVKGSGVYPYGSSVTIRAEAGKDHFFSEWKASTGMVYGEPELTLILQDDLRLTACFERYAVTEGIGQTWSPKQSMLRFRANGPLSDFTEPLVDGRPVPADGWTAVSGSTVLTLSGSYLKTLSRGTHTLILRYRNGDTLPVTFTVKQQKLPDTGDAFSPWVWVILAIGALILIIGLGNARKRYR